MLNELKAFLFRADVLSLAVAVIIAGAFQKIIDSLVGNVITPVIGMLTGGVKFDDAWQFGAGEAMIKFGAFVQSIINFIIIGIVLFMLIKAAGKKSEEVK